VRDRYSTSTQRLNESRSSHRAAAGGAGHIPHCTGLVHMHSAGTGSPSRTRQGLLATSFAGIALVQLQQALPSDARTQSSALPHSSANLQRLLPTSAASRDGGRASTAQSTRAHLAPAFSHAATLQQKRGTRQQVHCGVAHRL
jgi:hypothetical protein